jgi:hypothetical protein
VGSARDAISAMMISACPWCVHPLRRLLQHVDRHFARLLDAQDRIKPERDALQQPRKNVPFDGLGSDGSLPPETSLIRIFEPGHRGAHRQFGRSGFCDYRLSGQEPNIS